MKNFADIYIMENNSVVLKRRQNTPFYITIYSICQKLGKMTPTEKGRKNMINSVNIPRYKVYERLQLSSIVEHFKYHMNNYFS